MSSYSNLQEPPAFYVDAIPGARAAHDAYKAAQADLLPLFAAERAAIQGAVPVVRWAGTAENMRRVPAPGMTNAQLEAAVVATTESAAARAAGQRRVRAAYDRFDNIVRGEDLDHDHLRKLAAQLALDAHSEVVDAWQTLQAALAARDEAYTFAGTPGTCWELSGYHNRPQAAEFAGQAVTHISKRVDGFPAQDVSELLAKAV